MKILNEIQLKTVVCSGRRSLFERFLFTEFILLFVVEFDSSILERGRIIVKAGTFRYVPTSTQKTP